MNKKKIISVGIFAVVIMVAAGVAYYCYPSAINGVFGINATGDAISDNGLLAADSSSSLPVGDDGSEDDIGIPPTPPSAPASAPASKAVATPSKKNININPGSPSMLAASAPLAGEINVNNNATTSSPTPPPTASSTTPTSTPASTVVTTTPTSTVAPAPVPVSPPPPPAVQSTTPVDDVAPTSTPTSTDPGGGDDNASNTADVAPASDHVLIAAVQIAGAASSNDLVKLFNPTGEAIDMSGWKLHKKSSTGTDYSLKVFPTGSVIGAGGSFVWANSTDGFSDSAGANVSSTETLSADNSVALMDAAGNIVDAVAWGTGASQYGEGPPYPTSPGANQLLSRRSSGDALVDTDDNSADFALQ